MTASPAIERALETASPRDWSMYVQPPPWAEISTISPSSPEWEAQRDRRIGASEMAGVLGAPDAYETGAEVWRRKLGIVAFSSLNDPLRQGFGHATETVIAQVLAERHGHEVIPGPWILDKETPLSGSVDLVTLWEGCRAFVECKLTWAGTNPYVDGMTPDRTAIQQIIYAALGGFEVAILAVVSNEHYGPQLDLRVEEVTPAHLHTAQIFREQAADWWETYVRGYRPPPDAEASDWARYASMVAGLRAERVATFDENAAALAWLDVRAQRLALEKEEAKRRDYFARLTEGQPVRGVGWMSKPVQRAAAARQVQVSEGSYLGIWPSKFKKEG